MALTLNFSSLESRPKWKDQANDDDLAEEPGTVSPSSFVFPNVHDVSSPADEYDLCVFNIALHHANNALLETRTGQLQGDDILQPISLKKLNTMPPKCRGLLVCCVA